MKNNTKGSFVMGLIMSNKVNAAFISDKILKALWILGDKKTPPKKRAYWSGMLQACLDKYESMFGISREEFVRRLIAGEYHKNYMLLEEFDWKGYKWAYSKVDTHLEAMLRKADMIKGNPYYSAGKRSFWLGVSRGCYEKIALRLSEQELL